MAHDDAANDAQPEPATAGRSRELLVDLVETMEDAALLAWGKPDAVVLERKTDLSSGMNTNLVAICAFSGQLYLQGVVEQVDEHGCQCVGIGGDGRQGRRDVRSRTGHSGSCEALVQASAARRATLAGSIASRLDCCLPRSSRENVRKLSISRLEPLVFAGHELQVLARLLRGRLGLLEQRIDEQTNGRQGSFEAHARPCATRSLLSRANRI